MQSFYSGTIATSVIWKFACLLSGVQIGEVLLGFDLEVLAVSLQEVVPARVVVDHEAGQAQVLGHGAPMQAPAELLHALVGNRVGFVTDPAAVEVGEADLDARAVPRTRKL